MKIEKLGSESDSLGKIINIHHTPTLAFSPVYTFFLKEMASLIDMGFNYPVTNWSDSDCAAVYAEHEGEIVGHIVYSTKNLEKNKALWIVLSAVKSKFRGRGIYTILHKYFENCAVALNCTAIASHVHIKNEIRLKSAESAGMKPHFYLMVKKI